MCRYVGGLVQGRLADALYARGLLSLLSVRRIFTAVCLGTPALTLILLSWPGCNATYAVSMARMGFTYCQSSSFCPISILHVTLLILTSRLCVRVPCPGSLI